MSGIVALRLGVDPEVLAQRLPLEPGPVGLELAQRLGIHRDEVGVVADPLADLEPPRIARGP